MGSPRPLMKKVSGPSRAPICSRQRLLVLVSLVSAMAVVSFLNLFETLATFQFTTTSKDNQHLGSIESIGKDLQMFPMGVEQFNQKIHHQIRDEDNQETLEDREERLAPPVQWPPTKGSREDCLYTKDYGLLERLSNSSRLFCAAGVNDSMSSSPYTFYHVPEAGLSATKLENFVLDIRGAEVAHNIVNLADDGGGHDPRFRYMKNSTFCNCAELQDRGHGAPNIWKDLFVGGPGAEDANCGAFQNDSVGEEMTLTRAVVLVRKDDHNPFFQISAILNAWIMMKTLGWERNTTQLMTLDRAWPTPVDDLRHGVLGPEKPVIGGEVFQQHVVRFESALLAPYEVTGPLMSHLDDNQPCHANAMIAEFRDVSLQSMAVSPRNAKSDPRRCLVTIISRRSYSGRRVQRVWQNEDEILNQMREEYHGECEFQALDFVNMTMHDQMQTMLDSDVVIGMHGAGMVNVMWTRPETLVIEIFPRQRYRWGYRNLCQYLGCRWQDFRRGRDIRIHTSDPNDMDKYIPYAQWKTFFDPLFRNVVDTLEQAVGGD